jgi:hypothetical protein
MEPGLRSGDRLLVRGGARGATAGRIVIVRLPGVEPVAVKRLALRTRDGWWVERDNPREGADSWQRGAVAEDDLLGVAICRLWPRPGRLPGAPRE